MFKNTCWANWLFTLMVIGLAIISISSALTGCGNKSALTLPSNSAAEAVETKKK